MLTASEIQVQTLMAWNARDFARIRELLHPEYSYVGGDGQEHSGGPDVGMAIAQGYAAAFSDGKLEVLRTYTQGDVAVAELVATGTHTGELFGIAPTGRALNLLICNIVEVRDGKIWREREYMDMLHLMRQLGVVPEPGQAA